jgi:hypothetical protein
LDYAVTFVAPAGTAFKATNIRAAIYGIYDESGVTMFLQESGTLVMPRVFIPNPWCYNVFPPDVNTRGLPGGNALTVTLTTGGDICPYWQSFEASLNIIPSEPVTGMLVRGLTYKNDGGDYINFHAVELFPSTDPTVSFASTKCIANSSSISTEWGTGIAAAAISGSTDLLYHSMSDSPNEYWAMTCDRLPHDVIKLVFHNRDGDGIGSRAVGDSLCVSSHDDCVANDGSCSCDASLALSGDNVQAFYFRKGSPIYAWVYPNADANANSYAELYPGSEWIDILSLSPPDDTYGNMLLT